MGLGTLASLLILLFTAAADASFTEKRLSTLGVDRELNRFIVRLARRLPLGWAVWLGVGVPTALIAVLGVFVSPWVLTYVAGMRTTLWLFQRIQNRA